MSKPRVVLRENPWTLSLYDEKENHIYDISLGRCKTSAGVLDWIAQLCTKSWASDELIGTTTRALYLILDLQESYCSGGSDLTSNNPVNIDEVVSKNIGNYVVEMEAAEKPLSDAGWKMDMNLLDYLNYLQEAKERAYRRGSKYFEPA